MDINSGHYHEALDRARTISLMIDELLAEHPAVEAHPKTLGVAVRRLQDAAGDLYQLAGRPMHKSETPDPNDLDQPHR